LAVTLFDSLYRTQSGSYSKVQACRLVAEIAKDADDFYRVACTMGGYIVFPRNRVGQTGWTINQYRGMYAQSLIAST
jgi:hypothetical protein